MSDTILPVASADRHLSAYGAHRSRLSAVHAILSFHVNQCHSMSVVADEGCMLWWMSE